MARGRKRARGSSPLVCSLLAVGVGRARGFVGPSPYAMSQLRPASAQVAAAFGAVGRRVPSAEAWGRRRSARARLFGAEDDSASGEGQESDFDQTFSTAWGARGAGKGEAGGDKGGGADEGPMFRITGLGDRDTDGVLTATDGSEEDGPMASSFWEEFEKALGLTRVSYFMLGLSLVFIGLNSTIGPGWASRLMGIGGGNGGYGAEPYKAYVTLDLDGLDTLLR